MSSPTLHSQEVIDFLNADFPATLGRRAPVSLLDVAPIWAPVPREQTGEDMRSCTYALANRAAFVYRAKFDPTDSDLTTFEPVNWVTVGRRADGSLMVWAS